VREFPDGCMAPRIFPGCRCSGNTRTSASSTRRQTGSRNGTPPIAFATERRHSVHVRAPNSGDRRSGDLRSIPPSMSRAGKIRPPARREVDQFPFSFRSVQETDPSKSSRGKRRNATSQPCPTACPCCPESVTFAVHLQNVDVVSKPIQQRFPSAAATQGRVGRPGSAY
jgi:hypothetical protein